MTLKAGINLDLTPYCDKILEFFYFRKGDGFIDTDKVDQELSIPYEHCELAIKKLENDGYLEFSQTSSALLAKITSKGEIYYRTSSYKKEFYKSVINGLIKTLRVLKDGIEIILFLVTIGLSIYTFSLNQEIEDMKKQIEILTNNKSEIDSLNKEVVKIKSEILLNKSSVSKDSSINNHQFAPSAAGSQKK